MTLPLMTLFMLGGELSYAIPDTSVRTGIVALFFYCEADVIVPFGDPAKC